MKNLSLAENIGPSILTSISYLNAYESKFTNTKQYLKEALEKNNLGWLFPSGPRAGDNFLNHVGADTYVRTVKHILRFEDHGEKLLHYVREFYPFVGQEGLRLIDKELFAYLKEHSMLQFVPTEAELLALRSGNPKQKPVANAFLKRLEGSEVGTENVIGAALTSEETVQGFSSAAKVLGRLAEEYQYGIRIVMEIAKAKKQSIPRAAEIAARSLRFDIKFKTRNFHTNEMHTKQNEWSPPFYPEQPRTHGDTFLYKDDEETVSQTEKIRDRMQDAIRGS